MDFFIPNWEPIHVDWAQTVPHIENDDAVSEMRLLQSVQQNYGAILYRYLPQLKTQMHDWLIAPDQLFSVFDYIQGTEFMSSQVLDYHDFDWPEYSFFDLNNFRNVVYYQNRRYAQMYFDIHDNLLWLDYYNEDGSTKKHLVIDSRGFISRTTFFENNQAMTDVYYDSAGSWRIKHDLKSDAVTVNPFWKDRFAKQHYDHLDELCNEVMQQRILPRLNGQDRLIVSLANENSAALSWVSRQPVVFSASKDYGFDQIVKQLTPESRVVADSAFTKQQLGKFNPQLSPTVIPLMRAQFKLGHSQRLVDQQVAIFTENLSVNELNQICEEFYPRLLDHPKEESLHLFCYSGDQENMGNEAIQRLQKNHPGKFLLPDQEDPTAENELNIGDKKRPKKPVLTLTNQRMTSISQLSKFLDTCRVIVDMGPKPDELVEMLGISIGIPQLQRVATDEVIDHQNGLIFDDMSQVASHAAYYLDSLKTWNKALANDVQIMNRFSNKKLMKSWQSVWHKEMGR